MFAPMFLSFDSFLAAFGLGLVMTPERRGQLCLLFGLCDGLATFAGSYFRSTSTLALRTDHPWILPAGICAWLVFVIFVIHRIVLLRPSSAVLVSLLPMLLSIDNLLAGSLSSEASLPTKVSPVAVTLFSANRICDCCAPAETSLESDGHESGCRSSIHCSGGFSVN